MRGKVLLLMLALFVLLPSVSSWGTDWDYKYLNASIVAYYNFDTETSVEENYISSLYNLNKIGNIPYYSSHDYCNDGCYYFNRSQSGYFINSSMYDYSTTGGYDPFTLCGLITLNLSGTQNLIGHADDGGTGFNLQTLLGKFGGDIGDDTYNDHANVPLFATNSSYWVCMSHNITGGDTMYINGTNYPLDALKDVLPVPVIPRIFEVGWGWDAVTPQAFIDEVIMFTYNPTTNLTADLDDMMLKIYNGGNLSLPKNNFQGNLTPWIYNATATFSPQSLTVGESTTHILNVTYTGGILTTNATLYWNNTNMGAGIRTKRGNNTYIFTNTFNIPSDTGNSTGEAINWTWYYNMSGKPVDTISGTQTVYDMSIDNCAANPIMILNYTLITETNRSLSIPSPEIKATITLDSLTGSGSWNYSTNVTGNVLEVCIPEGLLNSSNYTLNSIVEYTASGYVTEFNYIDNYLLTNADSDRLQHIYLHSLAASLSTSVLYTYKDQNFAPVGDAVIDLYRYYVDEGKEYSVEHGKTNEDGETVLHIVSEDVLYRYYVRKNGVLLYMGELAPIVCLGSPCQKNIYDEETIITYPNFTYVDNFVYSINIDRTARTVTLIYATGDGENAEVDFNVTLYNNYNNQTVCNNEETSNSGTIICTIPASYEEETYTVKLWVNGNYISSAFRMFNLDVDPLQNFGITGLTMAGLIVMGFSLMGLALGSGIMTLLFGFIGFVAISILGLFAGGVFAGGAIIWLAIAVVIIIFKIAGRRGA